MTVPFRSGRFRLVSSIVFSLWVILTFVTSTLFLATGRAVPRSFTAWDEEPGLRLPVRYWPDRTLNDFLWVSSTGQTYATASSRLPRGNEITILADPGKKWTVWGGAEPPPERVFEITFRDTLTNEQIGVIKRFDHYPGRIQMSPDKTQVAIESFRHILWNLPEGKRTGELPHHGIPVAFSKTGKLLLLDKGTDVAVWDIDHGREVAFNGVVGRDACIVFWAIFFDKRDQPLALISASLESRLELWSIAESKRLWQTAVATGSDNKRGLRVHYCLVAGDGAIVAIVYSDRAGNGLTKVWSLPDGKLLGSYSLDDWVNNHLAISSDGRYFLHGALREDKTLTKLVKLWPSMARWIPKDLLVREESRVHDLSTGNCWPGLPECERAAFVQGSDRLVIFNKAGRYEFDVPPRWQYFTPWAWAALGGWLSLIGIWWRLRKCDDAPHSSLVHRGWVGNALGDPEQGVALVEGRG